MQVVQQVEPVAQAEVFLQEQGAMSRCLVAEVLVAQGLLDNLEGEPVSRRRWRCLRNKSTHPCRGTRR